MTLSRRLKYLFRWTTNQGRLAMVASMAIFFFALPWHALFAAGSGSSFAGIPSGFLLAFIGLPLGLGVLISFLLRQFENNDRHDPELENE